MVAACLPQAGFKSRPPLQSLGKKFRGWRWLMRCLGCSQIQMMLRLWRAMRVKENGQREIRA